MRKSFITKMPNRAGSFRKAAECFAEYDVNVTRISYNKAVDTHTLFIEVEGEEGAILKAQEELRLIGYLTETEEKGNVVLLEFEFPNRPGQMLELLRTIDHYGLNISYISSHAGFQPFKMGIFVDNRETFEAFMMKAKDRWNARELGYSHTAVSYDNSIFYTSYVDDLAEKAGLNAEQKKRLTVNVNRAMQVLDERNLSPANVFDCIAKFATAIIDHRGVSFNPRITTHMITENTEIILIEPPTGSNTAIIKSNGRYLFMDTGYAIYKDEMLGIFDEVTGGFDKLQNKTLWLSHPDLDHVGLANLFDEILVNDSIYDNFKLEEAGERDYREQNNAHLPYVRICKLVTGHKTPETKKFKVIAKANPSNEEMIYECGELDFEELHFKVFCGQGGHVRGENLLFDFEHRIVFPGDIFVNVHGYTEEQAIYNKYAPFMLSSVDTNADMAKLERLEMMNVMKRNPGVWKIFGGHGAMLEKVILSPEKL